MKRQKIKLLVLSALTVFAVTSCNEECIEYIYPTKPDKKDDDEDFVPEKIDFYELFSEQEQIILSKNETKSYLINKNIEEDNYLQVLVKTSGSIKGKFVYFENDNQTHEVEEEFYIESTNGGVDVTDFRQFLDAFRPLSLRTGKATSVGAFNKTLKCIEFVNFSNEDVTVKLMGINISDRVIPEEEKMIYLKKDELKIGMDLLTGGTLSYLERYEYDGDSVDLVIDSESNLQIGVDYSSRLNVQELSNHVNLINIYDAGRQIQQSYYASIGGFGTSEAQRKGSYDPANVDGGTQNGYTRNISVTADKNGYYWPYNPVQGGDEVVNFSQVIDFRKTEDELYCKTRALDWAGHLSGGHGNPDNNRVTKSYMENWFKIKDGLLYATNRFVDWSGFYDLENIEAHNIEMPATYISQPLNYFQAYLGSEPFKEDAQGNLDETPGILEKNPNLGNWKYGGHRTDQHKEDWFAWTNSEDFGVGIYIPGATYYSSGRSMVSTKTNGLSTENLSLNKGAKASPMASDYLYNKDEAKSDYTPCYVRNVSYTAPVKAVRMKEYIPLEYTYVVAVDYVPAFRAQFRELYESGEISDFNNAGLNAWN